MAVVVTRVEVLTSDGNFTDPFSFEIEYECSTSLKEDLEWKMIYVGSAESEKFDQELESVLVGPVVPGQYKFIFEGNPPDASKLPQSDVAGLTVILLTCSYKGKEFVRIGYFLNNEYEDEAMKENPPEVPLVNQLKRNILASDPRVTRFPADFDNPPAEPEPQPEPEPADMQGDASVEIETMDVSMQNNCNQAEGEEWASRPEASNPAA